MAICEIYDLQYREIFFFKLIKKKVSMLVQNTFLTLFFDCLLPIVLFYYSLCGVFEKKTDCRVYLFMHIYFELIIVLTGFGGITDGSVFLTVVFIWNHQKSIFAIPPP